jgi:hypothetical protein
MIGAVPLVLAVAGFCGESMIVGRILLALYLVLSLAWFWLASIGVRNQPSEAYTSSTIGTH